MAASAEINDFDALFKKLQVYLKVHERDARKVVGDGPTITDVGLVL